jgi:hypothetical protein
MKLELGIIEQVITDPHRHAIACAAMCRGMSTEQIEHAVQSGDILQQRLFYKRQRDELFIACKKAHEMLTRDGGWCPPIMNDAIASVEASL